jgi:hypothetical protein
MKILRNLTALVPPSLKAVIAALFSLMAGVALALMFSYLLYRIGLPSKPFIYVSF